MKSHAKPVDRIAISPDGRWLATAGQDLSAQGDLDIRLWNVKTGELMHRLTPRTGGTRMMVFSRQPATRCSRRRFSRACSFRPCELWDVATGTSLRTFGEHQFSVGFVAISADGRMLAAGNIDKAIRLWEVASGTERGRIHGHESSTNSMAFSPDGRFLAAASNDAPVFIWDVYGRETTKPRLGKLSKQESQNLWHQLADTDATVAFKVICELILRPNDAVPTLADGWKQSPQVAVKQIEKWVGDLDSDQFAVRKTATTELERSVTGHEELLRKLSPRPGHWKRGSVWKLFSAVSTPSGCAGAECSSPRTNRQCPGTPIVANVGRSNKRTLNCRRKQRRD